MSTPAAHQPQTPGPQETRHGRLRRLWLVHRRLQCTLLAALFALNLERAAAQGFLMSSSQGPKRNVPLAKKHRLEMATRCASVHPYNYPPTRSLRLRESATKRFPVGAHNRVGEF
jgi:hypothetical protein